MGFSEGTIAHPCDPSKFRLGLMLGHLNPAAPLNRPRKHRWARTRPELLKTHFFLLSLLPRCPARGRCWGEFESFVKSTREVRQKARELIVDVSSRTSSIRSAHLSGVKTQHSLHLRILSASGARRSGTRYAGPKPQSRRYRSPRRRDIAARRILCVATPSLSLSMRSALRAYRVYCP